MSNVEIITEDKFAAIISANPGETAQEPPKPVNHRNVAEQVAAVMKADPPLIIEIGEEENREMEICIPLGGDEWKRISRETGLKTTKEMKDRFGRIAREENLDIAFGFDDAGMKDTVRFSKKPGIEYGETMHPANIAFIKCFK